MGDTQLQRKERYTEPYICTFCTPEMRKTDNFFVYRKDAHTERLRASQATRSSSVTVQSNSGTSQFNAIPNAYHKLCLSLPLTRFLYHKVCDES